MILKPAGSPRFQRFLRQSVTLTVGWCVVAYFAWYAINGERGMEALRHLRAEIAVAEQVLAEARAEREWLERRAQSLRPQTLDPDMLEERARIMLHWTRPDEVIILEPAPPYPRSRTAGYAKTLIRRRLTGFWLILEKRL